MQIVFIIRFFQNSLKQKARFALHPTNVPDLIPCREEEFDGIYDFMKTQIRLKDREYVLNNQNAFKNKFVLKLIIMLVLLFAEFYLFTDHLVLAKQQLLNE